MSDTVADQVAQQPPAAGNGAHAGQPQITPEILEKLLAVRSKAHEVFGRMVMGIMTVPRYKHLSIADLQHILLEPLIQDRIMFAQAKGANGQPDDNAHLGIAIWASVSEDVDTKIREQIKAGVFPVRLQPKDWTSGKINWLLDVIAPNEAVTEGVVGNFVLMKKDEQRHVHPAIVRLLSQDAPKRLGLAAATADNNGAAA